MNDALGRPSRILLLGGASEIGLAIVAALPLAPDTHLILAGRNLAQMEERAATLPCTVTTTAYDATALETHRDFADTVFADADIDLVISAAGVLIPQSELDRDPQRAGELVQTNFTGHVTTLLAVTRHLRNQGHGTLVVLSSIAAVRPRRANFVYGASKAGLDAFAQGLADSLHGSGVRLLLVRPGFVTGRMTQGMPPTPLSTTPDRVAAAVATALTTTTATAVWVPRALAPIALLMRLTPRVLWRRVKR
jgi:decaprenylphospho-beta-D-erythro-pentofuranosid-2-ulose 2-reductase